MDISTDTSNLQTFSIKPKVENFDCGLKAELSLRYGQSFIEDSDNHPKALETSENFISVTFNLSDSSQEILLLRILRLCIPTL